MIRPLAYGIDFGTTNSSVAAHVDSRTIVLRAGPDTDPPEALRSVVFLHRDGDQAAGRDAARRYLITAVARHRCHHCPLVQWLPDGPFTECRQFKPGGACNDARLMSGLKHLLVDPSFDETSSWARVFRTEDLIGVVLWALKRVADDYFDTEATRAVIGYPVHLKTSQYSDMAFERLTGAARNAGFKEVRFCPEPVAAVAGAPAGFAGKTVCSVDFGGGTFDVAILRFADSGDGTSDPLAIAGVPVGGESFDSLIFERLVAPMMELNRPIQLNDGQQTELPAVIRAGLKSLNGVTRLAADPHVFTTLRDIQQRATWPEQLAPVTDLIFEGQGFDFWAAIEGAKKELSQGQWARLTFRRGAIDVDLRISRSEFEELIEPAIRRVRACIERALDMASLRPRDVDVVIRTGGSSLLPAFNAMLDDLFGAARVESRPTFSSVAAGLAELAADEDWGST